MLGETRIKKITNAILTRSSADQTEVVILAEDDALTRFANSTIHQNVAVTDTQVRIRVILGSQVGVATTNNPDEEALVQTLENAMAIARLLPENPYFKSLPGPQTLPKVTAFSEATAGCAPEDRAKKVGIICMKAHSDGIVASGALSTSTLEIGVENSLGTYAYFPTTYADINTVIMSDTSAGYASALALDINDLDFEAIGAEAVNKCLRSKDPRPLDPGTYTVILEPYAVQDFIQMMSYTGFSALAMQEGRSFMKGKIGQQIVDPRISIWDDGQDPAGIPLPFDFEGVPKHRVDLIEKGIARGVVYDSYRAGKEEGKTSTGHALPAPNAFGPLPINLFLAPGSSTLEDMIQSTKRGVYVTRFHYTRPVEPTKVVITGMTRDGTFLIENGEIACPVKNLRFTQSYLEALNTVEMIGKESRLLAGLASIARDSVPTLKLGAFTFTGATEF
jgi:predicted Zn-dependent protease